jgi:hypothetical protein
VEARLNRLQQVLLLAALLALSWIAMQAAHELGHVLTAWATGGEVRGTVLHPLVISRTDVSPNPRPLAVAWGGPLVGSLLPLAVAGMLQLTQMPTRRYADFFVGFCLIANGAYVGLGAVDPVGDAAEMLRHGSPPWLLVAFGAVAFGAGLWIWHRASSEFGFGRAPRTVTAQEACWALAVAALVTAAAALLGRR